MDPSKGNSKEQEEMLVEYYKEKIKNLKPGVAITYPMYFMEKVDPVVWQQLIDHPINKSSPASHNVPESGGPEQDNSKISSSNLNE